MKSKTFFIVLLGFLFLIGCAAPASQVTPTTLPPLFPSATPTLFIGTPNVNTPVPGNITPPPGGTVTGATNPASICNDPQVTALIDSFKNAVLNSDGALLSALVSPSRSMDVAIFRDGTVITYDQEHAKFLFETTFEVDWGAHPGSGEAVRGSFHDIVVPELVKVFSQPYTTHCNELKHGGATYELEWPYEGEFYSVHFPGTADNGNMDWQTWVMGIEYVSGKPYIYAIMQFFWEP